MVVATHLLKNGKRELLVRWKNLPESEDSWEPEETLVGTPVHDRFLVKEKEPDVIVATHMLKDGKRELLVRWKNLPESEESWEPEEKLVGTAVHDNLLVREKEIRAKREAKAKEGKGAAPAASSEE